MSYRILTSVVLFTFIPLAYAVNDAVVPSSKQPGITMETGLNNQTPEHGIPLRSNSTDPYQTCFANSTWVVPPQTLLAYTYDNADFDPVTDQTVWVISNYNKGYFFGQSYTAIDNSTLSQRYLIGSVTTKGKVYITFYSGTSSSTDLVTGIGKLYTKSSSQCAFIMQMNSGQNGVSGLTHWSYMIPVKPGDLFYNNLPSTNMSVPEFLARFS